MAYREFKMDNHWLPFTPNRSFKKDPRVFVVVSGVTSSNPFSPKPHR